MKPVPLKAEAVSIKEKNDTPPPYSEPTVREETVYEDDTYRLRRLWSWEICSLHEDCETGYLNVMLDGASYNKTAHHTYATVEGKRLTARAFNYCHPFSEGKALVGINGKGYGFIDRHMNFVFPPQFDRAESFSDGVAAVAEGKDKFYIDKNGNRLPAPLLNAVDGYGSVREICEGMVAVCTEATEYWSLPSELYSENGGVWGYLNTEGEEIIKPQYVCALDFTDGIAIVAKGDWQRDGSVYKAVNVRWGAIDDRGNTVIPFNFDGLIRFHKRSDVLIATVNGAQTVVNRRGERMTQATFEGIEDESYQGLFVFSKYSEQGDELLFGIYDTEQDEVVLQPIYTSLHLLPDGTINAESYDPELGRSTEKLLDLNGNPLFHSEYSYIHTWKAPYETMIDTEDGRTLHGMIEPSGRILIPCIHEITYDGFHKIKGKIVFEENGMVGLKELDGNVLLPPAYADIPYEINGCYAVTKNIGNDIDYLIGLITPEGKEMLPFAYDAIYRHSDGKHVFLSQNGICQAFLLEKK